MVTLMLGPAQRDLVEQYDHFVISSDEPLTAVTDSPVPEGWTRVPRLILLTTSDESDSHTVQVNGSWLNTGLLKHWIGQLFASDADVQVVNSSEVLEPDLVPA